MTARATHDNTGVSVTSGGKREASEMRNDSNTSSTPPHPVEEAVARVTRVSDGELVRDVYAPPLSFRADLLALLSALERQREALERCSGPDGPSGLASTQLSRQSEPSSAALAEVRRTFLIAPVRGRSPDAWASIVAGLEAEGWRVYWPARDTEQSDPVGTAICAANAKAIAAADAVHVVWDGESQGCLFDLGMAFALGKRVIPLDLPPASEGKSFQNMVRAWADG